MNLSTEYHPVPKPSKSEKVKRPMKKRRSKRARDKEFPKEVKQAVWERSGGLCERCKCRRLMHFHHCHFRSEGSACTNDISNCLGLCDRCHMWDDDSAHKSRETRQWCIDEAKRLAQALF
ncbi:hypothetical protein AAC03nite_20620 [Alicyclobacillus acidoterrestris]|nr:hypothetical protein AAC03nite_20620 [Alicyclobacillus acidoterrestris]